LRLAVALLWVARLAWMLWSGLRALGRKFSVFLVLGVGTLLLGRLPASRLLLRPALVPGGFHSLVAVVLLALCRPLLRRDASVALGLGPGLQLPWRLAWASLSLCLAYLLPSFLRPGAPGHPPLCLARGPTASASPLPFSSSPCSDPARGLSPHAIPPRFFIFPVTSPLLFFTTFGIITMKGKGYYT